MSAQCSDAHSVFPEQTAPFIFLPQLPFMHLRPATQSASLLHLSKQALVEALQRNGAQTMEAPSLHLPAPSQVLVPTTAPESQVPLEHTVPAS